MDVKDIDISSETNIKQLSDEFFKSGGFTAKKVGIAVNILESMFSDQDCTKILSFPACIISTGTRGLIKELVKRNKFNYIFTTCGTLDHDFARIFKPYKHGSFEANDAELRKKGVNRLGNIFVPNESYGDIIEEKLQPILQDIYNSGKRDLSTYEFCWEVGKRIDSKDSILYWTAKNEIPMIIPGITDGVFGIQMAMFMQDHPDFRVDVFKDEKYLIGKFFGEFRTGALMIGGGISKHHVIWWNQFCNGLDYAVYITTAVEHDGSLSGARVREGISWGKVSEKARYTTVEGDATVLLPLIVGPFM